MFNLTYSSPAKIAGDIYCESWPTLGLFADLEGQRWDVFGFTESIIWAAPYWNVHPYYTSTATESYGFVEQTWMPYRWHKVETIEGGRFRH